MPISKEEILAYYRKKLKNAEITFKKSSEQKHYQNVVELARKIAILKYTIKCVESYNDEN